MFVHGAAPLTRALMREARLSLSPHEGMRWSTRTGALLPDESSLLSEIALPSAARERLAATADIGFGNVVKILLRFATKWWADHGGRDLADLSFLLSDATVPTWWTQHPAGYPVPTGWFAGPQADRVSSLTATELVDMRLA